MRSCRADVDLLLAEMKSLLQQGKDTLRIDRYKNNQTLAMLGRTWDDVKFELMNLSYHHYVKGPEEDRDFPQTDMYWFFKMVIDQNLIYIKFKVRKKEDGVAYFMSFHLDGMP